MRFRGTRLRSKTANRALADMLAEAEFDLKDALVAARKAAGLEQKDIAEQIGVDKSTISRFERLDSNPTLTMIRNYAYAVGAVVRFDIVPFDQAVAGESAESAPSRPGNQAGVAGPGPAFLDRVLRANSFAFVNDAVSGPSASRAATIATQTVRTTIENPVHI
ncbi:hypothetical protein NRB56_69260 [Nocardia sp. RB56]|uniref:HTH cro/C1-type domain-containing protein n=2 Tax=Nocardia aurantia TaxID=2585199 RepID=A0A7K0E0L1_9NOCA|nr:hypothetical protein [Nocardia aurantia]